MIDVVALARTNTLLRLSSFAPAVTGLCSCCAHMPATHAIEGRDLCLTCVPAFVMDEPDIDAVAQLVFLPAMDQGVLSRMVVALHTACAAAGCSVFDAAEHGTAVAARRIFGSLRAKHVEAVARTGTDRPSELRAALRGRPPRAAPGPGVESGVRVLMLGRWFAEDPGLYRRAAQEWARGG
jgi:hypothetical protein